MEIVDRTDKPREDEEILDAIELMGTVIVKALKYPPELVIFAPTIRDALKELLTYRKAIRKAGK